MIRGYNTISCANRQDEKWRAAGLWNFAEVRSPQKMAKFFNGQSSVPNDFPIVKVLIASRSALTSRHGTSWGNLSDRADLAAQTPAACPIATAFPVTR